MQWPKNIAFNRWELNEKKESLCSVCRKSNNDAFIQCDLCKCWIHEICMTNIYDPCSFQVKGNNNPFWCKVCIDKTKQFMRSSTSLNWFFSHNMVSETEKNKSLLRLILTY